MNVEIDGAVLGRRRREARFRQRAPAAYRAGFEAGGKTAARKKTRKTLDVGFAEQQVDVGHQPVIGPGIEIEAGRQPLDCDEAKPGVAKRRENSSNWARSAFASTALS